MEDDSSLTPRQELQYSLYEAITELFGKFDQSMGANGAHYAPPDKNPFIEDGLVCANCIFYEGPLACEIVQSAPLHIDPNGVCKLWVIPQELVRDETLVLISEPEDIEERAPFQGNQYAGSRTDTTDVIGAVYASRLLDTPEDEHTMWGAKPAGTVVAVGNGGASQARVLTTRTKMWDAGKWTPHLAFSAVENGNEVRVASSVSAAKKELETRSATPIVWTDTRDVPLETRAPNDGTSNTPPQAARDEAARGLAWRREFGRGGTGIGVARARDISNGKSLSDSTIRRMVSYFARHEVDKQGQGWSPGEDGYPSAGRIAWALWGGDPGKRWAEAMMRRIRNAQE